VPRTLSPTRSATLTPSSSSRRGDQAKVLSRGYCGIAISPRRLPADCEFVGRVTSAVGSPPPVRAGESQSGLLARSEPSFSESRPPKLVDTMAHELTSEQVKKVASLARLSLSESEVTAFASQLSKVLGYVERLAEVDTSDVAPMAHAIEDQNVLRDDEPREGLPREQALQNAPHTDGRYFIVPQILDAN
jgi:aspartyl-tRNA(Asn)/glutamyl-tRNA(Gln) amidotransferase subunit C